MHSVVPRAAVTGDEHGLVLEKVKARGTETNVSDEVFELEGEQTLAQDVFTLLEETFSSASKSLMI